MVARAQARLRTRTASPLALALLLGATISACHRDEPAPQSDPSAEGEPSTLQDHHEDPPSLGVAELVFGLPLPEGGEPILYRPDLRTFSHQAPLDELHRFFMLEIPEAERASLDRGERFSRPDSDAAVFVFRDPRPGGPSRLAYVPREGDYDHEPRTAAFDPGDEDAGGPTRIVMPDAVHPAIDERPDSRAGATALSPARQEQLQTPPAFRSPEDYFTAGQAYAPPGYLQPGSRRSTATLPRRAHPSEFGGQRQPGGGTSTSRFVPSNPGAQF